MAERRMISSLITESDEFLELPVTAQNFYFHLQSHADDRGFVKNPKTVMKMCGANAGDAKALLEAKFILSFPERTVILIKHWRIHNFIRKDRFHESAYVELLSALYLDENDAYSTNSQHSDRPVLQSCQPNSNQSGTTCHTEVRLELELGKSEVRDNNNIPTPIYPDEAQLPFEQTGNGNIDSAILAAYQFKQRRMNDEAVN